MYRNFDDWRAAVARDEAQFLRLTEGLAQGIAGRRTARSMSEMRKALQACNSLAEMIRGKINTRGGVAGMAMLPRFGPQADALAEIEARLAVWPELSRRLDQMLAKAPGPLFPSQPGKLTPEWVRIAQEDNAWLAVHLALQPVPGRFCGANDATHHADIPEDMSTFLWLVRGAVRLSVAQGRGRTFLDVGCGIGLKVLQAAQMVHAADGLDYRDEAADIARRVLDHDTSRRSRIFVADALNFDDYGDYDIVYCYKPLSDPALMRQLERRILAQVRPGTVLVFPHLEFLALAEDLGCAIVVPRVYVAHCTAAAAQSAIRRAGRRPQGERGPLPALPSQPVYLAPAWAALRAQTGGPSGRG